MSALAQYLERHYRTAEALAADCAITPDVLADLVDAGLVPAPSYVADGRGGFVSQAFGTFEVPGLAPAQYFHPGNAVWVARALEAMRRRDAGAAQSELRTRFEANFATALAALDRSLWRLPDSFDGDGQAIADGLAKRTADAWAAFGKGIFSLCVTDPSSETTIARKEILQEALGALRETHARTGLSPDERRQAQVLIDEYAQAAMPFSPLEYPRSSRKRLVEDFGAALAAS